MEAITECQHLICTYSLSFLQHDYPFFCPNTTCYEEHYYREQQRYSTALTEAASTLQI